jgi:hypothetical protein
MIYFVIITPLQQLIPSQTAVNLINFIVITLIYYITKQRVCETISIIKMLTISKNLLWPRDLESFKGGNLCRRHKTVRVQGQHHLFK